jgi:hypothetical protein
LEVQFLDRERFVLDFARHHGFEIRLWRQRRKTEHLEQLLPIFLTPILPIIECLDFCQTAFSYSGGFAFEILDEQFISGRDGVELVGSADLK